MSSENVELAQRIAARMAPDDFVAALKDEQRFKAAASELRPLTHPEFEIEMVGPEYSPQRLTYTGVDGYVAAWREWLAPYESYRAELEDYLDAGDKVVLLVRQIARAQGGTAPIETESAVLLSFRDGKLERLELHIQRETAMKAAGLAE